MKKLLFLTPVVSAIVACGGAPVNQSQLAPAVLPKSNSVSLSEVPSWVSKLPEEPGVIFAYGTGVSNDMSMADQKALHSALHKLCVGSGAKLRSQEKNYKSDSDYETAEQSEHVSKTNCSDIATSGTKQIELKHVLEGSRIRSYVLVALPLVAKIQAAQVVQPKEKRNNADSAFKELDDAAIGGVDGSKELKKSSSSDATISVVQPNGSTSSLSLMPVENEEYKARREAALQKPGAAIFNT